mgnify:CR=1 FL=1
MAQIRWGIIGCGNVTEVKSGPAFNKVADSKLVAVMRRDAAKAADYAQRHGVPKWYSNAQDLIDDADVNPIYIATPPDSHETYTLAAIKAGKPVYVEKPMALHAASAKAMMEAAQKATVKLTVAHYRRQQPYFKKVKELLDAKSIGEVLWIDLRFIQPHRTEMMGNDNNFWRINPSISGGGIFHDLAPHQLDLMRHFFGAPHAAKGISYNHGNHYNADDVVSGTALLPNNIIFRGLWHFNAPEKAKEDVCEIWGTKGKLRFSVFGPQVIELVSDDETNTFTFEPPQHVQQPMIEKVVAYFNGKGENPCSAAEGVQVMQWMDDFTRK